jgi:hypothetical protein
LDLAGEYRYFGSIDSKDVTFPAASSVDMARFLYFPGNPQAYLCLGGAVKAKDHGTEN